MARLTKLERMSDLEKQEAIKYFNEASDDTFFPPEVIALIFKVSESWLQKMRSLGGGIPFSKPNGINRVKYQKIDALAYFVENKKNSTSAA